jgi:hypothetical protein
MGDRANIVIRDEPTWVKPAMGSHEAVFLYGHWSGYDLPETLRKSLARSEQRWTDASYLARVLFEDMIGEARGNLTGYGIYSRLTDNEYDLLVLLPAEKRLVRLSEDRYKEHGFGDMAELPSIPFEDYVAADERTWDNLTEVVSRV